MKITKHKELIRQLAIAKMKHDQSDSCRFHFLSIRNALGLSERTENGTFDFKYNNAIYTAKYDYSGWITIIITKL